LLTRGRGSRDSDVVEAASGVRHGHLHADHGGGLDRERVRVRADLGPMFFLNKLYSDFHFITVGFYLRF
jgi:hypothetical protein